MRHDYGSVLTDLLLIGGSLSPYFKISHGNSNPRIRRGTNRCG